MGGAAAYATLAVLLYGIWRGTRQTHGRISGQMESLLRSPWFYAAATALFLGLCRLGWIPIPVSLSPLARAWMLAMGALLLFPGLGLILWGRLALGKYYFVSTARGAQLFSDHQLIQSGPFAIVRHPMYLGLILAACGSLLV